MQGTMNSQGHLKIMRGSDFDFQLCPYAGGESYCGTWCPHFNDEYGKTIYLTCGGNPVKVGKIPIAEVPESKDSRCDCGYAATNEECERSIGGKCAAESCPSRRATGYISSVSGR